jgi:hypothetical protein
LFNAERANFMFCDSEKGELYRNYLDDKNQEHVETFSLQKGLAGYVANSLSYLISNQIDDDTRFLQVIDDPTASKILHFEYNDIDANMETKCIMTVPVFTSEEHNSLENLDISCPRGVLQLINKAKNKKFIEEDAINI